MKITLGTHCPGNLARRGLIVGAAVAVVVLAGCGQTTGGLDRQAQAEEPTPTSIPFGSGTVAAGPGTILEVDALGNASGRSGSEKITIHGTGTYVDNVVAQNVGSGYRGHHHIYSADGSINYNQANHNPIVTATLDVSRNLPNYTQVCAEGWRKNGGGNYTMMGRPCLVVSN